MKWLLLYTHHPPPIPARSLTWWEAAGFRSMYPDPNHTPLHMAMAGQHLTGWFTCFLVVVGLERYRQQIKHLEYVPVFQHSLVVVPALRGQEERDEWWWHAHTGASWWSVLLPRHGSQEEVQAPCALSHHAVPCATPLLRLLAVAVPW